MSLGPIGRLASGRKGRAEAAVLASAYELASLARRLATRVANGAQATWTLADEFAAHRDEVLRILSLSASIEGTVTGGASSAPPVSGRVFLPLTEACGLYATHYLDRVDEWYYIGPDPSSGLNIIIERPGMAREVVVAADLGLCPYGGGSGAWHPNVWTEKVDGGLMDGKDVARRVDEDDGVEIDVGDE